MASNRNSFGDEPESGKQPSGKKDKSIDHVVDELRSVLSGLQQPAPAPLPPPLPEPTPISEPVPAPAPPPSSPVFKIELPKSEPLEPSLSSDNPSDQDFWNGNVLGWPSDPPLNDEGPEKNEPNLNNADEKEELPAEPSLPPVPDVSLVDRMWLDDSVKDKVPPIFPQNIPMPDASTKTPGTQLPENSFEFPPAPLSPEEKKSFSEPAPAPVISDSSSDLVIEPFGLSDEPIIEAPQKSSDFEDGAPEPSRVVLPENLKIPIPSTLHQLPAHGKKNVPLEDKELQSDEHEKTLQMACMFPAGQESLVQGFVEKLTAAVESVSEFKDTQTVLMNTWDTGTHNFGSWKKAASLAGANILFIFVAKKDKDQFKDLTRVGHQDEIACRLIFLEQIPLRTLYSDVVADLMRRLHVKG